MLIAAVPSLSPPARAPITGAPVVLQTERPHQDLRDGRLLRRAPRGAGRARTSICSVRRGETLGVVGESGSGKSTVARCIARLIEPTDGAILIEGADVAKLPARALRPHRKRVQIVFQDPYRSLNPRRTVGAVDRRGADEFRHGAGRRAASARAQLMRLVGLDPDALDRFPHQFSGGQRQRICIARALAMEPGDPGRRRGGVGARRLGAGAGAGAARRRAQALQSRGAVHHPRPARRRAGLRPHRRDAQGRGRRGRARPPRCSRRRSTTTRARCSTRRRGGISSSGSSTNS